MENHNSMQKWYVVLVTFSLMVLSACKPATHTAVPLPPQSTPSATPTAAPPVHTPIPYTQTATIQPTLTTSPSIIPPTATPALVLPDDLEVIHAGNLTELQQLATLPVKEIYELAFSPSGNLIATFSEPWDDRFNDYLEVWDLRSGKQILRVDKWDSPSQLFFPDETTLYASDRQYDLASGEVIRTLEVVPLAFSPDGKSYTTGNYLGMPDESILQLIDVETSEEVLRLTHPGMVMFLDFSPDGRYLIGGFQGNHFHIKVWDIATGQIITDLMDFNGLEFSPDSKIAASFKDGQIYLFNADGVTYQTSYPFTDPNTLPDTMDFSAQGDVLALEDMYTIRFVMVKNGKKLLQLPNQNMVKFSPDGRIVVTWIYQEGLKIWGVKP